MYLGTEDRVIDKVFIFTLHLFSWLIVLLDIAVFVARRFAR